MIEVSPSEVNVRPAPGRFQLHRRLFDALKYRYTDWRRLSDPEIALYIQIVAHPECMPTREEIADVSPMFTEGVLDIALAALSETPLVCSVVATHDSDGEDLPGDGRVRMYGLTEAGAIVAEKTMPLDDLREDYADYQREGQGERIKQFAEIPRPAMHEVHSLYVPDLSGFSAHIAGEEPDSYAERAEENEESEEGEGEGQEEVHNK